MSSSWKLVLILFCLGLSGIVISAVFNIQSEKFIGYSILCLLGSFAIVFLKILAAPFPVRFDD